MVGYGIVFINRSVSEVCVSWEFIYVINEGGEALWGMLLDCKNVGPVNRCPQLRSLMLLATSESRKGVLVVGEVIRESVLWKFSLFIYFLGARF